ncbi:MAG: hypothetical protein QGG42_09455 [Phycisphaerae bacterium]|jgi:hypothetical protein|nr:hypothetical protein [Phycisphaerae bacterium]
MRNKRHLIIAVIVFAGLQAGCGRNEGGSSSSSPSGPKAVALKLLEAIASGDGNAMASCYDCSTEDKEYLIKQMPFLETLHKLIDAGNKAYGEKVWVEASVKAQVGMIKPDLENAKRHMQCEITGDTAKCILKGLPKPLNLHKKGDQWLVIPQPRQLPPMSQRGDRLKSMRAAMIAIDAIIPKVGAANVSADDICAEVRKLLRPK